MSLRELLKPHNVAVTLVKPGYFSSNLLAECMESSGVSSRKAATTLTPASVAASIAKACDAGVKERAGVRRQRHLPAQWAHPEAHQPLPALAGAQASGVEAGQRAGRGIQGDCGQGGGMGQTALCTSARIWAGGGAHQHLILAHLPVVTRSTTSEGTMRAPRRPPN